MRGRGEIQYFSNNLLVPPLGANLLSGAIQLASLCLPSFAISPSSPLLLSILDADLVQTRMLSFQNGEVGDRVDV